MPVAEPMPVMKLHPIEPTTKVTTEMLTVTNVKPGEIPIPVPNGKVIEAYAALTGFNMRYPKEDHHVRDIGVSVTATHTDNQIKLKLSASLDDDTDHKADILASCLVVAKIQL